MTTIALASLKHSPGVTTAAVAIASAAGEEAVVIEADASGGDIAARSRLTLEPGLVTLAASGRHSGSGLDFDGHTQPLPAGGHVVVGPMDPEVASAAIATTAPRLSAAHGARLTVVDCGRVASSSPVRPVLRSADVVVVVLEPTVVAVEHLRRRLPSLDRPVLGRLAVLLVGDRPYRPAEVESAAGIPVLGSLPVDPRGVAALYGGFAGRRSVLVRAARSVLDRVSRLDLPEGVLV
jgi:hypothetical protein